MRQRDKIKPIIFLLFFIVSIPFTGIAQNNDILENSKIALKSASSKELVKYFNDVIELGFKGEEKKSYSKTQAEFVLRDFFKKYPPVDFQYLHQGSSKESMKYAIGKYSHSGGSFRVVMVVKQFKGVYLIDSIVFEE